jgi:hypothetical protein
MAAELPAYALEPIKRCYRSLLTSLELLHISMRGISTVSNYPKMSQRLMDLTVQAGQEITDEMKADLEEANRLANFADGESKNGFPFLHAFATVGAWGTLEVTVEDLLVGILLNEPKTLGMEGLAKIRVPLARFEELDREERMRFILRELGRAQTMAASQGVSAFENLLQVFDLSGDVDEDVRKLLWEMNHVRNIIVHRDSHADLRLIESCPWLNVKTGDCVLVDHERYGRYSDAICGYVGTLLVRLRKRYNVPVPSPLPDRQSG